MDQMLWYLLASTRGGPNRLRILGLLKDRPYNAHQLTELLSLDYRTVRHHLRVLVENGLLVNPAEERYGSLYFVSAITEYRWPVVDEIRVRLQRTMFGNRRAMASRASGDHRARPA